MEKVLNPETGKVVDCEVVGLLKKGIEEIKQGWVKSSLYLDGAVCALGALGMRRDSDYPENIVQERAIRKLFKVYSGRDLTPDDYDYKDTSYQCRHVYNYNDRGDTKQEDVIALFELALEDTIKGE